MPSSIPGGRLESRRSWLLLCLVLTLLAASLGLTRRAAAAGDWWNDAWRFRVPITVQAGDVAYTDKTVEVALDFGMLLGRLGEASVVDLTTMRVVEVTADGQVVDAAVPFQFDPATDAATRGTLILQMTDKTAAGAARHYVVYFGAPANDAITAAAPQAVDATVTLTNTTDEGFASYRITTPHAVYFYHKEGGGFSSLVDDDGIDWINWNDATGNAGDFRGIPNMVHPADGGFFHPGRTTSRSKVISQGTMKVTFESTSDDGQWKSRWEIFPDYARMTVLRAAGKYWFQYEGTPGGALDRDDFVMRSNQKRSGAFGSWAADLAGEEWVYVADPAVNRSIFLVHHTQDNAIDSYRASSDRKMTIFGFGRSGNKRYQTQVPDQFSFGLVNSTDYATVAQAVEEVLGASTVSVGAVETR